MWISINNRGTNNLNLKKVQYKQQGHEQFKTEIRFSINNKGMNNLKPKKGLVSTIGA